MIFVSINHDVMPLAGWLGDLPDRVSGYDLDRWAVRARNESRVPPWPGTVYSKMSALSQALR